jgi:hypothetical protein
MSTPPTPNNETPTNPNEDIVDKLLINHKPLKHLRGTLVACIASLDYDILKELAIDCAINLLADYNNIQVYNEKITKTKPTTAPYPRSIRLNFELTCSEKVTRETPEFTNLRKEADLLTKKYQQTMRQLIVKTIELDKGTVAKKMQEAFFHTATQMIEMKVLYESMLLPDDSLFAATFKNIGETKTMSGFLCNKILEAAKTQTSDILYYYLNKAEGYLGIAKEEIINGFLSRLNKNEAETIQTNFDNNGHAVNIKVHVQKILQFIFSTMMHDLIQAYTLDIKQRNALAVTEATFKAKATEEATEAVETALATEDTISAKRMEDLLEKKLDKKLKKSMDNTNNSMEKRLEALQKTIEELSKNSMASRKTKGNGTQPASAKKRKQNNQNNKKKKKAKMESNSDSNSNSDSDNDDEDMSESDSDSDDDNQQSTPNKNKNKNKKSKNRTWYRNSNSNKKKQKSNQKGKQGNQGGSPKGKGKRGKK